MASVELSTEQIIELIRQLPQERKREVLLSLAKDSNLRRRQRMDLAEQEFRRIASERGLQWDAMTDQEREALADDLIHEDRSCAK
jgi:Mg/Co/Ni transporter MgtE